MGYIRYRKGVSDLRHLRHPLTAADESGTLTGVSVESPYALRQLISSHSNGIRYKRSTPSPCSLRTLKSSCLTRGTNAAVFSLENPVAGTTSPFTFFTILCAAIRQKKLLTEENRRPF